MAAKVLPYAETHQQGTLSVENPEHLLKYEVINGHIVLDKVRECDFGVQIAADGRVWICLDGIAFLRFSPHPNGRMEP